MHCCDVSRMEVLFWGLRDLKRLHLFSVKKPQVTLECGGIELHSTTLVNIKHNTNFDEPLRFVDMVSTTHLH
jgi:hypothetical protein